MSASTVAPTALQALYRNHHGWLVGWLRRRTDCAHQADDLAQDTFLRVLVRPPAFNGLREPRAWLSTIAHGLFVDHRRRQNLERAYQQAVAQLSEPAALPSPESSLLLLEALARVDAWLAGLPPKARTAFLLSRLEGLSHVEIARRMDLSLSSVEKYMATAIRHCLAARALL